MFNWVIIGLKKKYALVAHLHIKLEELITMIS
jgi:hypothetical protein